MMGGVATSTDRMALYREGLNDNDIAAAEHVQRSTIQAWRKYHRLPANKPRWRNPEMLGERRRLYDTGLGDGEIAERQGVDTAAICHWRQRLGLPPNNPVMRHSPGQRAARMFLYGLGYTDWQIAREQRVGHKRVFLWRRRLGLTPNTSGGRNGQKRGKTQDRTAQVLSRIERAIGRALPPDIRADAVADLYLAVVDGSVSIDAIEREARKFGSRVLGQFASKYGPRSLDEEIGNDGDGFTLLDTLVDDSSSDWLERSGATVW